MKLKAENTQVIVAPETSEEEFYGAIIRDVKLGPRHELTLQIETWPRGKSSFGGGEVLAIRFGAISNYDEVKSFFETPQCDGFHYLRETKESKPNRRVVEIEFDGADGPITIRSRNVSMYRNSGDTHLIVC